MNLKRRDLLLAAGMTLVFGTGASARILVEGKEDALAIPSLPRRLQLRHAHTGETFTGLYRDHVGPIPDAMIELAHFLRDHHENVRGPIFVETLDFLADVIGHAGQTSATILSAYRTKKTNENLSTRLFGVAEKSQHIAGRALDLTLDRKLEATAGIAKKMSRGGVGWYPHNHFIHLDSGPVRSWTMHANPHSNLFASAKPANSKLSERQTSAILSGNQPKRPLTVKERLQLHRALAKKQASTR